MTDSDVDHFARRAREERAAAEFSRDARAASSHAALADRYEAVVRAYRGLAGETKLFS